MTLVIFTLHSLAVAVSPSRALVGVGAAIAEEDVHLRQGHAGAGEFGEEARTRLRERR